MLKFEAGQREASATDGRNRATFLAGRERPRQGETRPQASREYIGWPLIAEGLPRAGDDGPCRRRC